MFDILSALDLRLPIIQAPMAGVSTPSLAAAVSNAGGLGSIGVGATSADGAHGMILELQAATNRPFNVNLFCHRPARIDPPREAAWLSRLAPEFDRLGARPPERLTEIYRSFVEDDDMLRVLVQLRPAVVSFHFGLPSADRIAALRDAGAVLLASATSLPEARAAREAGVDAVVAQGYEAGGHRGVFDPDAEDDQLGMVALVRLLSSRLDIPVIAAGGIMDGAGVAAALDLGAQAAQMGTAFVLCPETSADAGYRAAMSGEGAAHTTMTRAISGRPARCLANAFTRLARSLPAGEVPDYPIAYDAGKALNAAARAAGESGYGAQWAGQGAPLARAMPAAELMTVLERELGEALRTRR